MSPPSSNPRSTATSTTTTTPTRPIPFPLPTMNSPPASPSLAHAQVRGTSGVPNGIMFPSQINASPRRGYSIPRAASSTSVSNSSQQGFNLAPSTGGAGLGVGGTSTTQLDPSGHAYSYYSHSQHQQTTSPPPLSPNLFQGLGETSRNVSYSSLEYLYDALRGVGNGGGNRERERGVSGGMMAAGSGSSNVGEEGNDGLGYTSPRLSSTLLPGNNTTNNATTNGTYVNPTNVNGQQLPPRSRRSSVALAVSVSLASRSRSHTPVQQEGSGGANGGGGASRLGTPPVSPGKGNRRGSRDRDRERDAIGTGIGMVLDGLRPSYSRNVTGTITQTTIAELEAEAEVKEPELGWEETFEHDDRFDGDEEKGIEALAVDGDREDDSMRATSTAVDEAGQHLRNLALDSLVEEAADDVSMPSTRRAPRTASEVDSTGRPSRSTSFGSTSAVDHDMNGGDEDETFIAGEDGYGNVFRKGDRFGCGIWFQEEIIEELDPVARLVSKGRNVPGANSSWSSSNQGEMSSPRAEAGKEFEVVRKLGSGSYAIVYLVREVGDRGQEYALKCLSKRDLEEDSLDVQLFEATIHMSLPKHDNIVTLYQTLQTSKWLFLLMEMCPGEDLFYWLEHSRDTPPDSLSSTLIEPIPTPGQHLPPLSSSNLPSSAVPYSSSAMMAGMRHSPLTFSSSPALAISKSHMSLLDSASHHSTTPTTPSLLASYSANSLLAYRRLRLIASMFVQMCEAVALCHEAGVSHRDIKPENFICCDSEDLASTFPDSARIGAQPKKVIVKLTDFGLATTEAHSGDVECGSRPYMAYECRNELGPDYAPRPADVWSLGIVLLNMLFHRNPWTDPAPGNKNFDGFLQDPIEFLMTRFTGIGREVASYLATRVFAVDIEIRVSAREFGKWAKDLPAMITGRRMPVAARPSGFNPGPRERDQLDFTKSPVEPKGFGSALSQFSSLSQTAPATQSGNGNTYNTRQSASIQVAKKQEPVLEEDADDSSRTESALKRKKRGVRKGKAAQAAAAALLSGMPNVQLSPTVLPPGKHAMDDLAMSLAEASQALARELSTANPRPDRLNANEFPRVGKEAALVEAKKSKWKGLAANLTSANPDLRALADKVNAKDGGVVNKSAPGKLQGGGIRSANLQSLGTASQTPSLTFGATSNGTSYYTHSQTSSINDLETWRRPVITTPSPHVPSPICADIRLPPKPQPPSMLEYSSYLANASHLVSPLVDARGSSDAQRVGGGGGGPPSFISASSGASVMSSGGSSFFYRRSNASTSTFATTVTSHSSNSVDPAKLPSKLSSSAKTVKAPVVPRTNVKQMTGLPWETDQLPRQMFVGSQGEGFEDLYGSPPVRKSKKKKPEGLTLESASPASSLGPFAERPPYLSHATDSGTSIHSSSAPHSGASGNGMFPSLKRSETSTSGRSIAGSGEGYGNGNGQMGGSAGGQRLKQQISKIFTLKREKPVEGGRV